MSVGSGDVNPKATSVSSLCDISSSAKAMVMLLAPIMVMSVGRLRETVAASLLVELNKRCCCAVSVLMRCVLVMTIL